VNNIFKQYFTGERGILFDEERKENSSKNEIKKVKKLLHIR